MEVASASWGMSSILAILLALGGGGGLPLGVPPAAEDPLMYRVAPEECLYYTTWAGMADPDPSSGNATEQLLAEPEVQQLFEQLQQRLLEAVREKAGRDNAQAEAIVDDVAKWVGLLASHPTALFIADVKIKMTGPDVTAGAVVQLGKENVEPLQAALRQYQAFLPHTAVTAVDIDDQPWQQIQLGRGAPPITWGVKGQYLIVGVGKGAVETILQNARTDMPQWLADARQQVPVARRSTFSYINFAGIVERVKGIVPPEKVDETLESLGLANVTALMATTGLDEQGFVNRALLQLKGEPHGLLSFAAAEPLTADELSVVPCDATLAVAARGNLSSIVNTLLASVGTVQPQARQGVEREIGMLEEFLGIRLRDDLFAALGDRWCVYNSPSEGGLVVTGLTAVVSLKDPEKAQTTHDKLLSVIQRELEKEDSRRRPKIHQFEFAGHKVYYFDVAEKEFPLAPAWCLADNELIVATFPQNIKAFLSRGSDFRSLATVSEVAAALDEGQLLGLGYADVPQLFQLAYPFVPMIAQSMAVEMQREGIDFDISIIPSAAAIAGHLRPAVVSVRRTSTGIEMVGRQTLPGGNIGTTLPTAAGLLVPAVSSARKAAGRVQSANNLKQLGIALFMYHNDHDAFPPAFTADDEGKPLLSWRVEMLPYLGQKALYDEFHHDEPWDSPHNHKLIGRMPPLFRAARSRAPVGQTNYLAVLGAGGAFSGKMAANLNNLKAGAAMTAVIVETADQGVPWTKPVDFTPDPTAPTAGLRNSSQGGFNVLFADGHVSFISINGTPDSIKRVLLPDSK